MQKKLLIDASHQEETRIVLLDRDQVEEFDFESGQKKQTAGNIFLAKVTRVEPSLQAAFLDYGGNRHGFLAFSEIHPDYYQIPVADREALLAEERDLETESDDFLDSDYGEELNNGELDSYATINHSDDAVITSAPVNTQENLGTDVVSTNMNKGQNELLNSNTPEISTEHTSSIDKSKDNGENPDKKIKKEKLTKRRSQFRKNKYKIQEVIKVRQVLLIQVVKDERGNKGAALTTYISLAGRYCVLMPNTAKGGGISRKITNIGDRKKLKETANQFSIPEKMGLIIRTAGAKRTKVEIKRDFEYLLRQWEQIRDLTLKSMAPCPIYEEGSVIKRSIRDLYNKEINEIIVEGEAGFKEAKEYMKMLMPSHAKKIKNYDKIQPIFSFYNVENYLSAMFNPTVQLKSGGYIVIGITEALVAIDVNSGRATKESGIEATALKTNLEAADEIARQLRMRDLAGLIVIDFIDMEERKNNVSVERKIKESLKLDRARIQVGRISTFGLLEMSRQRLRYGMVEATTQPCPNCHGTGLTRSNQNLALAILRAIENKKTTNGIKLAEVKAPVEVANYLLNQKRNHLETIEKRLKIRIIIHADITLQSPNFVLDLNKSSEEGYGTPLGKIITVDGSKTGTSDEIKSPEESSSDEKSSSKAPDSNPKKQKRRRRRSGKSKSIDNALVHAEEPHHMQSEIKNGEKSNPKEESEGKGSSDKVNTKETKRSASRTNRGPRANRAKSQEKTAKSPPSDPNNNELLETKTTQPLSSIGRKSAAKETSTETKSLKSTEKAITKPNKKKRVAKSVIDVLKANAVKKAPNKKQDKRPNNSSDEAKKGWWSRKNPK